MLLSDESDPHPPGIGTSQRKRLTVLFTDLCGSTELARRMEVELYGELLAQVRRIWHEAASLHAGLVLRTQGDGAMLVFGYPHAHEHDGLRAVHAALRIHAQLKQVFVSGLPEAAGLRARSAIHAGVVLLAEGSLERGRFDLIGDVANSAAKLEKSAAPGDILVTLPSLGPHAGLFLLDRIHALAGNPLPDVPLFRVLGLGTARRRFESTAQRGLTPLVGRSDSMLELCTFLHGAAPDGVGCVVITAPPGLGKTRLLEELAVRPEMVRYICLRGSCESFQGYEALQPFLQMLRAYLAGGSLHGRALAERALAASGVETLRAWLACLAAEADVVLMIDDWQWADDASRQLLQALRDLPRPPLLLLTARPQADGSNWIADAHQIKLQTFDESETATAVRRWLPDADPFLVAKIHAYAGGVPLFVEELCHSASSEGLSAVLDGRGAAQLSWISSLVASRLARLPTALADVVRAASVIGNDVPRWMLEVACKSPLTDAMARALADADFLFPDHQPDSLRFKHGVTRDAVYEASSFYPRKAIHERLHQALLARQSKSDAQDLLAALAYHCRGAGQLADAAQYAERAGDKAAMAGAMDLARTQYQAAMTSHDAIPNASAEQQLQWCRLASKLGMASIFDPLALNNDTSAFEKAVALAKQLGDQNVEARALYWLGYILYGLGQFRAGVVHARAALALSRRSEDLPLTAQIEATLGQILVGSCAYDEALALMNAAIEAKRQRARPGSGVAIGSAYSLACKGSVLADRGDFLAGHACFAEALSLLNGSTHPVGNSVRNWIAVAYIWEGRWDEAEHIALESVRIAENTRALLLLAVSRSTLGFARWCRNGDPEGLRLLSDAVGWLGARRARMFTSLHFAWLAQASAAEGRIDDARKLTAHVLRRARQGERLGEAIACRAMALIAARSGDLPAVRRWQHRAELSATARGSMREHALNAHAFHITVSAPDLL